MLATTMLATTMLATTMLATTMLATTMLATTRVAPTSNVYHNPRQYFMKYDPKIHHRRSIRLKGYDYSQLGSYFVTICTQHRKCLFGEIKDRLMNLNPAGHMVKRIWQELPQRFPQIEIDEFVIMPNHLHGIIWIAHQSVGVSFVNAQIADLGLGQAQPLQKTIKLGDVVGAFKSITTYEYTIGVRQNHWQEFPGKLWQRNYYEQIVREEESLEQIHQYIANNPFNWPNDRENQQNCTR
jgi:REP element-mobilizing transposase RayT